MFRNPQTPQNASTNNEQPTEENKASLPAVYILNCFLFLLTVKVQHKVLCISLKEKIN